MAPSLINKRSEDAGSKQLKKYNKIKKKITDYQKFIKNNFEYVGEKFTYEARSIHYKSKKKRKVFTVQHQNKI